MYGMVNKAIEDMVRRGHGDAAWEEIKMRAGVDVEMFLGDEPYDDDITYRLVDAVSARLGTAADDILVAFGRHWISFTAQEGYGPLMAAAGQTIPEFFANLPNFHNRVAMMFPRLQPPRFACENVTPTSLRLHYFTHRHGLGPFVIGLLYGLGDRMGTPVQVVVAETREAGADHDVFDVSWSPRA